MLAMQEDMLNQLNQEVEKLKLMLLAKTQSDFKREKQQQQQQQDSNSSQRMLDTAKAHVPPIIIQDSVQGKVTKSRDQNNQNITVKRQKGKQLIVPDELKEAQRQHKYDKIKEFKVAATQQQNEQQQDQLIKSHVSLSECDERSIHLIEQSPRDLNQGKSTLHTISNTEDGATLQL